MFDPLSAPLKERRWLVLDGALATELERRGADLADPLWSAKCLIEAPDLISAVHVDYFRAGADIATTATYQASFEGFRRRGIEREAAANLMRGAVDLATAARDVFWADIANRRGRIRPLVAASVGPYGAFLADGSEYRGDYVLDEAALAAFHRPRLQILAQAGADLIACETIPCLREARVLAQLLCEFPTLSAWVSFSCRDGGHTCAGEEISRCVSELRDFQQIAAIGVNCSRPALIRGLLLEMRRHTTLPLIAYPNSGEGYDAAGKRWSGVRDGDALGDLARTWNEAGARIIGGCCRTTPRDIEDLRATRDAAPIITL